VIFPPPVLPPLAFLGLGDGALGAFLTLAVLALIAVWIALIVFTYHDARKRISDPFLIGCATAASFFPFVGTLVYTILRPAEYLDDVKEREWDVRATQAQLRRVRAASCRKCGYPAEPDFLRCPSCRSRLREPCPSCDRPIGLGWKVCPYCEKTLIEPTRKASPSRGTRSTGGEDRPKAGSKGARAQAARGRVREEAGRDRSDGEQADGKPEGAGRRPRRSQGAGGQVGEGEKPINAGDEPGGRET
jgi:hypothetical protein